ncbi:hypothetical protein BpHYR1_011762 [Brachionus plicatilis]|uniref:Uncharacterized protein n=1 Tax=Brachionus plicatilis TaxID=10195 RepID=A0A3M7P8F0_BRAPC|nr:hypothetical protein BpHYR1_011762 [Brachionus plicatilis]
MALIGFIALLAKLFMSLAEYCIRPNSHSTKNIFVFFLTKKKIKFTKFKNSITEYYTKAL